MATDCGCFETTHRARALMKDVRHHRGLVWRAHFVVRKCRLREAAGDPPAVFFVPRTLVHWVSTLEDLPGAEPGQLAGRGGDGVAATFERLLDAAPFRSPATQLWHDQWGLFHTDRVRAYEAFLRGARERYDAARAQYDAARRRHHFSLGCRAGVLAHGCAWKQCLEALPHRVLQKLTRGRDVRGNQDVHALRDALAACLRRSSSSRPSSPPSQVLRHTVEALRALRYSEMCTLLCRSAGARERPRTRLETERRLLRCYGAGMRRTTLFDADISSAIAQFL